jgi:hypothetical protein
MRYEQQAERLKRELLEVQGGTAEREARQRVAHAEEKAELDRLRYLLQRLQVGGWVCGVWCGCGVCDRKLAIRLRVTFTPSPFLFIVSFVSTSNLHTYSHIVPLTPLPPPFPPLPPHLCPPDSDA